MWLTLSVPTFPQVTIDAMEDREEETVFSVWVSWKHRVISFTHENEFEELQYPTHEEMFRFVIEKGNEGFGIQ